MKICARRGCGRAFVFLAAVDFFVSMAKRIVGERIRAEDGVGAACRETEALLASSCSVLS